MKGLFDLEHFLERQNAFKPKYEFLKLGALSKDTKSKKKKKKTKKQKKKKKKKTDNQGHNILSLLDILLNFLFRLNCNGM